LNVELEGGKLRVVSYGVSPDADLQLDSLDTIETGSRLRFPFKKSQYEVETPYVGLHNGLNTLAALAVIVSRGLDEQVSFETLLEKIKDLPQVPGRLERIQSTKRTVFVDYAHTPDALQQVLTALRPLTNGKLWVVFGCGGDRDKGKRAEMGKIARLHADRVVVTCDNPRTEEPQKIIQDILDAPLEPYAVLESRKEAIAKALKDSATDDVILIAGKGHEEYQIIGTEKHPFSDKAEALTVLQSL
jgi:UDP-N-acetylmuramoyl-L-alanyl-D-glutamate--2,6-diaminopimelate ligase